MSKNSFRFLKFLKPFAFTYSLGFFLYSTQGFAFPFFNAILMNRVVNAILQKNTNELISSIIMFFIFVSVYLVLLAPSIFAFTMASVKAERILKINLFRAFISSGSELSKDNHSGKDIAVINTDADTALSLYSISLSPFARSLITIVFSGTVIFAIDWRFGLISLAIGFFAMFAQTRYAKPLASISKKELSVNAESMKVVSDIFNGALLLRAHNIENQALLTFNQENEMLKELSFKKAFISIWQNLFSTVQGWLTLITSFALGGWLVINGQLSFAELVMIPPLCMAVSDAMSSIGNAWAGLQPSFAAIERVFSILDRASWHNSISQDMNKPSIGDSEKYIIRIKNLDFYYPSNSIPTLKNINLEIKENEMVAFVGMSGSGKSTLLRIIAGMYQREEMPIYLGKNKFTSGYHSWWRSKFSYVDQNCKLFDMSISDNIAMGLKGDATKAQIEEASICAYSDDFINKLPNGYNTNCGELGNTLSGGQKQRIAIARALIKKAPILVFDEVTSSLDSESEAKVISTILNMREYHTILITSHDINMIKMADKIVLLEEGRITAIGKHDYLMSTSKSYVDLATTIRK